MIERSGTPGGGKPPQAQTPPQASSPPDSADAPAAREVERDKAEPEKARTEIEAGDVADDLADFA
ncbi:hypothetical protein Q8W71_13550 [Methylobacterium sp. NEAU 140]|uniref:hypothetical protein n=1 Tax=Methylobacterium sp. NEAU 140 TaxID=3064945 RepID=UPI0027324C6B|nr:hypothetical protein [Methylobacterium sp. NEAU 140]MDP4023659.1 hypothetical protein [Methylobacterium sp. NEAU 140]